MSKFFLSFQFVGVMLIVDAIIATIWINQLANHANESSYVAAAMGWSAAAISQLSYLAEKCKCESIKGSQCSKSSNVSDSESISDS